MNAGSSENFKVYQDDDSFNNQKEVSKDLSPLEIQLLASDQYEKSSKTDEAFIGPIEEAPEHTVDNRYILSGYRVNHTTCKRVLKSLCTCHNESVNVWSHIGGVFVFIVLIAGICLQVLPNQLRYANQLKFEWEEET